MEYSKIEINIKYKDFSGHYNDYGISSYDREMTYVSNSYNAINTDITNRSDCLDLIDEIIMKNDDVHGWFIFDLLITCFIYSNDEKTPSYMQVYVPQIFNRSCYNIIEHGYFLPGNKRNEYIRKNLSNYTLKDYYRDYKE